MSNGKLQLYILKASGEDVQPIVPFVSLRAAFLAGELIGVYNAYVIEFRGVLKNRALKKQRVWLRAGGEWVLAPRDGVLWGAP